MCRELDSEGIRTISVARLVALSDFSILLLTPDYFSERSTQYEYSLLRAQGLNRVLVVTKGDLQVQGVPIPILDKLNKNEHVEWTVGGCAGGDVSTQAFPSALAQRLNTLSHAVRYQPVQSECGT